MDQRTPDAPLTIEEEQALGRRIRKGDPAALSKLVETNRRFATYLAGRYRRQGIDMDDLVQEANIGLMLAGRHFDPDRGVRFCTYAAWWIEAQLRRYLRRQVPVVRVPEGTQLIAGRLRHAEEKLLQQHHRVTLEMVAAEAGVDMATAELAVSSPTAAPLSLDQPANYPEKRAHLAGQGGRRQLRTGIRPGRTRSNATATPASSGPPAT